MLQVYNLKVSRLAHIDKQYPERVYGSVGNTHYASVSLMILLHCLCVHLSMRAPLLLLLLLAAALSTAAPAHPQFVQLPAIPAEPLSNFKQQQQQVLEHHWHRPSRISRRLQQQQQQHEQQQYKDTLTTLIDVLKFNYEQSDGDLGIPIPAQAAAALQVEPAMQQQQQPTKNALPWSSRKALPFGARQALQQQQQQQRSGVGPKAQPQQQLLPPGAQLALQQQQQQQQQQQMQAQGAATQLPPGARLALQQQQLSPTQQQQQQQQQTGNARQLPPGAVLAIQQMQRAALQQQQQQQGPGSSSSRFRLPAAASLVGDLLRDVDPEAASNLKALSVKLSQADQTWTKFVSDVKAAVDNAKVTAKGTLSYILDALNPSQSVPQASSLNPNQGLSLNPQAGNSGAGVLPNHVPAAARLVNPDADLDLDHGMIRLQSQQLDPAHAVLYPSSSSRRSGVSATEADALTRNPAAAAAAAAAPGSEDGSIDWLQILRHMAQALQLPTAAAAAGGGNATATPAATDQGLPMDMQSSSSSGSSNVTGVALSHNHSSGDAFLSGLLSAFGGTQKLSAAEYSAMSAEFSNNSSSSSSSSYKGGLAVPGDPPLPTSGAGVGLSAAAAAADNAHGTSLDPSQENSRNKDSADLYASMSGTALAARAAVAAKAAAEEESSGAATSAATALSAAAGSIDMELLQQLQMLILQQGADMYDTDSSNIQLVNEALHKEQPNT